MKAISKKWLFFIPVIHILLIGRATAETVVPITCLRQNVAVSSWREIRDRDVVKQGFDFSCGSASLATLMNLGFSEDATESEIIDLIFRGRTPSEAAVIAERGYSLLDLKRAAEMKGYKTFIYKVGIKHLYQLKGPVLIHFKPNGENHFAVLKKVVGSKVFLADPAKGNIRASLYRFKEEWEGLIMVIDRL